MGLHLFQLKNKSVMAIAAVAILLVGCGGGLPSSLYTVSGVVTGLSGGTTVTLQNNFTTPVSSFSNEVKAISALSMSDVSAIGASDVPFTFSTTLPPTATYNVVVGGQPTGGKTCTVATGSGKISDASISNVKITCGYTLGGSLSGLSPGKTVVLLNTGIDALTLNANATSGITFASALLNNKSYEVTVSSHPVGQGCRVANSSGTVSGVNVTNVATTCYDSGTLDPTFAASGVTVHDSAAGVNSHDYGQSISTDTIGNILVTGNSWNGSNTDMTIWRYASSGVLDTTFGSGGFVVNASAASGVGADGGQSITTYVNGKILVTGYSTNSSGNTDMAIWRYTSTGVLDTTFGSGGIVVNASAASGVGADDGGQSITTDSIGRILVTGYSTNSSGDTDMVIWRYTSTGALDATFGTGGIVVHNNAAGGSNGNDYGTSMVTDASGKIFVTGSSWNGSNYDMVIWRYTSTGALDASFGTGGIVVHNNAAGGSGNDYGLSIILRSSQIVVTGYSRRSPFNDDMVVWRYHDNGTLDTNFDTDGIVIQNNAAGGNVNDSGASITTDALGNILVTGHSTNLSGDEDMVIWRVIP